MPLYWFHIDAMQPPYVLEERLRSLVREEPSWRELFQRIWKRDEPPGPPFIGWVRDGSFKLHRDIRYRNSFLPVLHGRIVPADIGTRIQVTMSIHPLVAVFLAIWFGSLGFGASQFGARAAAHGADLIVYGMLLFGVALVLGGFIPEAVKARKLLVAALSDSAQGSATTPAVPNLYSGSR